MTSGREDWDQAADALKGLAMKLKLHYEQATSDGADEVRNALDKLGESMDGEFEALRNAVGDEAVKQDVKDAAAAVRDAILNSVAEVRSSLKR